MIYLSQFHGILIKHSQLDYDGGGLIQGPFLNHKKHFAEDYKSYEYQMWIEPIEYSGS